MNVVKFAIETILVSTMGMVICLSHAYAATPEAKSLLVPSTNEYKAAIAREADYWRWVNAPWQNGDQTFLRIQDEIDSSVLAGKNIYDLIKVYESLAKAHPNNAEQQFQYYYAVRKAASLLKDRMGIVEGQQRLSYLSKAIEDNDFPHTYSFVRLAFLCGSYCFPNPDFKSVGIRLLARNSKDYSVKYALTELLGASSNPIERTKALKYAGELIREYPERYSVYSRLAGVYYSRWTYSHARSDADNAIAGYKKYLEVAPSNDEYRSIAKMWIDKLRNQ